MRSLASFKQTTIIQQNAITFAVGLLCLCAMQLPVSGLFYTNIRAATTMHGISNIKLTKEVINLESEIVEGFDDLTRYFHAVTNTRTATLIIPKIKHFNVQLDKWNIQIDNLAAIDQASVTMIAKENLGSLEVVVDDIMKTPGVASVLESNVAPLMSKLSRLKQAQKKPP